MKFRNALKKVLWVAGMSGAIAVAPLALGTATASADTVNWDAIAECESGGNWSTNSGNGFYGGLQFKPATWASHGGTGSPATASREEQIRVAENVLRTQGLGAWPKCGSQAGGPTVWNASSGGGSGTGCSAVRPGSVLGIVDLRQICSAVFNPLAAFGLGR